MNCEVYLLHKNKKDSYMTKNDQTQILNALFEKGINLLYKTDLDYNYKKILSTLKQTEKSNDGIDIVFILNALGKTDQSPAVMAFEKICRKLNKATQTLTTNKKDYILELYSLGDMGNGYNACFTVYNGILVVALPKSEFTGKSETQMMMNVTDRLPHFENGWKINDGFTDKEYEFFKYEKKRVSPLSWKYYIPVKGDDGFEIVRKTAFLLALVAVFVSGGVLINSKLIQPAQVQGTYNELKNLYYASNNTTSDTTSDGDKKDNSSDGVLDSFKTLIKLNDEVQGWIYIPNTKNVDYPVMQCKSDSSNYQKYLYRDFNRNASDYGSIFIDYRSDKGTDSKNVILHGHNSGNNLMFSEVCNYKNLDFYKSTPTFTFSSRKETSEYVVLAAFITNTRSEHGVFFNYLKGSFTSESEFMNYIYQCRMRSLINTPVTVNEDDSLITLSTCSYEYKEFRTVVVARKVRESEKKNGFSFNTSSAYYNPNPLYPTVWYRDKGGKPPATTTFEDVYKSGGITWYDGDGISGQKVDPGVFFINEDPDYNDVASKQPEKSSDTVIENLESDVLIFPSESEAVSDLQSGDGQNITTDVTTENLPSNNSTDTFDENETNESSVP